jgi:rod shape determining protein RodA
MENLRDFLKRIDYLLIIIPLAIGAIGIIIINSITVNYQNYPKQLIIQIVAFAIGIIVLFLAVAFDSKHFSQFYKVFYALSILLQLTVFVPGLGIKVGGQQAWIDLFGITTIQPSEIVKITFAIAMAAWLERYRDELFTFKGFVWAFCYAAPVIGLVAYVDMGAGIIFAFMFIGMIFAAGLRGGIFARLAGSFVVLLPVLYRFLGSYQKMRFEAFLHPEDTEIEATYHVAQSKLAIGSGGIFGKGLGQGTIKESGLLPVQESDFIFSILCEEFGFAGGAVLIALYGFLIIRTWNVIRGVKEYFSGLLVVGLMCMFAFQIFENIGMTMGVMPVTGITLPFMSAGGSSIIANFIAVGLIIGVGARNKIRSYKDINTEPARD